MFMQKVVTNSFRVSSSLFFLDEYRSLFSYFDRDGGGTIGPDEIKQVMEAFNWAPEDKLIKVRMLLVTNLCITFN